MRANGRVEMRRERRVTTERAMLIASMSLVIDEEFLCMDPVRVGDIPAGFPTPDFYVTVSDADTPVLRIDVYADQYSSPFHDALVWRGNVLIGCGSRIYAVLPEDRSASTIQLASYYGHMYATADYVLIASGEQLYRSEADRSILWQSDYLGCDGVVVNDPGPPIVRGEADNDPPGGWRPFALVASTGKRAPV